MNTFESFLLAVVAATVFAVAFITAIRLTELKDEIQMLKSELNWMRRNQNVRIRKLETKSYDEYDAIAKIYEEETT